jgi:hypothetical protein
MVIFYHSKVKTKQRMFKNQIGRLGLEKCAFLCRLYKLTQNDHKVLINSWLSIHTSFKPNARYSDIHLLLANLCDCISNLGGFHGMVIRTKIRRNLAILLWRVTTPRNFVENWFIPSYIDTVLELEPVPPHVTKDMINIE